MKILSPCFMLFSLVLTSHTLGQTAATARISGLITNPAGAVIPGAVVRLTSKTTKTERVTRTDGEGRYLFAALAPGAY
jgi:hypothetical protein